MLVLSSVLGYPSYVKYKKTIHIVNIIYWKFLSELKKCQLKMTTSQAKGNEQIKYMNFSIHFIKRVSIPSTKMEASSDLKFW